MESHMRVLGFDELDQEAYCRLQQQAFTAIFVKNAIPLERLNRAFFTWKFAPPAGAARVAVVMHGNEMVATNAMFPLQLVHGEGRERGWQSCDTATSPAARGKGYFKQCIAALRETIPAGETFFGYPNQDSKRGLESVGWNLNSEIPFRMRPVWWGAQVGREVEPITEFGAAQDEFARKLSRNGPLMIERSAAYLNWRYVRNPLYEYGRFYCVIDGAIAGLLVVNRVVVRKRPILVVMEFLTLDERAVKPLLAQAVHTARSSRCSMLAAIGNRKLPTLVRIPATFLPKRQILMGQRVGPPHGPMTEPWLVQAGDWDVF
ncbi:MAG: GNAT family N-acetyltransferase [Planctomycetes bacterium]|nr:GNAT family N-acetyltransferase [Planctomycetota bacterium]